MQMEQPSTPEIPWTTRDVWFGAGCLGLWIILSIAIQLVIKRLGLKVDPGVLIAISEALLLLPVYGFTVYKYKVSWNTLGLRQFSIGFVGLGCGMMLLSYFFNLIYSILVLIPLHLNMQGDLFPTLAKTHLSVWFWVGGTIIAPFVEEIFFRGFMFAGLSQVYGWKKSALISSALFAMVHLQWTAILPIFLIGYIFAFLYHRSHSLWPGILMHMSVNTIAFLAVFLVSKLSG
jgi:uncharacterized protein